MKKVRIEIDGVVYEPQTCAPGENPCAKCVFFKDSSCGMEDFCAVHVGYYEYFEKSPKSFDEILLENKDVLHRLKMVVVPTVPQDDDSEYIND